MKKMAISIFVLLVGAINVYGQLTPAQQQLIEKYKNQQAIPPGSEIEKYATPDIYQQDSDTSADQDSKYSPTGTRKTTMKNEAKEAELEPQLLKETELKLFGHDIFEGAGEVFIPGVHDLPPDGYTFGPGDHILVNVWGRVDLELDLTIDREGKVFIPQVGELVVAGSTLDTFRDKLDNKLSEAYSDYQLSVSYGKLRQISIYVFGEVNKPGGYTVSSLANLLHALYAAGGITDNGSLRKIQLIRNTQVKNTYDLYDLLLKGDQGKDLKLLSGDVVYVPVTGPLVSIAGEIKRPAIYELTGSETALTAIELAGGATSEAFLETVSLDRVGPNDSRILRDLDLADLAGFDANNILLQDGDRLTVFSIYDFHENQVYLTGHVKHPGKFGITDSMRISELIDNGKQLKENAYTKRADLFRTDSDGSKTLIPVELDKIMAGDITADLLLKSLDSLVIYSYQHVDREKYVTISGAVKYPGQYKLYNSMRVSDLIFQAGTLSKRAYWVECELARVTDDQVTQILKLDLEDIITNKNAENDIELKEDDCVFIRQKPDWHPVQEVTVEGEVLFPGRYAIKHKDEKMSELIARAGGLTPVAFPKGALYIRSTIEGQVKQRNIGQIIENTKETRVDSTGNIIYDKEVKFDPSLLNRIIIDLPEILKKPGGPSDIALADSDYIYIPPYPSGVQVIGAVAFNGTIAHLKGKKAKYYIGQAGGTTPDGDISGMRLVKPNGKVYYGGKAQKMKAELGDAIIVPSKIKRTTNWGSVLTTTATIVGSVATTIFVVDRLK